MCLHVVCQDLRPPHLYHLQTPQRTNACAFCPRLAHPWYDLAAWAAGDNRTRFVRSDTGTLVKVFGVPLFNFSNPSVRARYLQAVAQVVASPAVAGVFIDFTPQTLGYCHPGRGCYNRTTDWSTVCPGCSPARVRQLRMGMAELFRNLRGAVGRNATIVCNPVDWESCDTLFFEYFGGDSDHGRKSYDDIRLLQNNPMGHMVEARAPGGDGLLVHALAAYLVGASNGTFFGSSFSPGWGCDDGWLDAMNASTLQARLFAKALGAPLGPASNRSSVYRREFRSGTRVFLNSSAGGRHGFGWAACIWWSDGEVSAWNTNCTGVKPPNSR